MEILNKEKPRNLWKGVDSKKYHVHVTISTIDSATKSEEIDDKVIYMDEIEKRKEAYGICGECNEPAEWPEGYIWHWDIENQKWERNINCKVALKSLDNSSEICTDFINEIKSYLQIYIRNIVYCYGITQDPNTKDYMMVLFYYLITKCWDAKAENRPSAKELYQILNKWKETTCDNEIYFQMREYYTKTREKKLKNSSNENKSESIKTHPQAIYTSRLLNFKNLPEPVNSSDLSSFQINSDDVPSVSANIISECFDVQFSELDLNEINQEDDDLNDES
ncbi:kinase-like domain-containing protein [Rhizophagus irregularis DAOM 181602=DAOM 197198]|nr:kinase-like domain-containing protein [Rhizophagus irregularis DAOM 181602=DAOM 197198]